MKALGFLAGCQVSCKPPLHIRKPEIKLVAAVAGPCRPDPRDIFTPVTHRRRVIRGDNYRIKVIRDSLLCITVR